MFKEQKEILSKEIKKIVRMISHQTEIITKQVEFIKQTQKQVDIIKLKGKITEMNNLLERFNIRFERISKLGGRSP